MRFAPSAWSPTPNLLRLDDKAEEERMHGKKGFGSGAVIGAVLLIALVAAPSAVALSGGKARKQLEECVTTTRAENGAKAIRLSSPLSKAAAYHAENMAEQDFFDHLDPDGNRPQDRVAMFSRHRWTVGENIGGGASSGKKICRKWLKSQPHRHNILDPDWDAFGVGYATGGRYGKYFVLVFGDRR